MRAGRARPRAVKRHKDATGPAVPTRLPQDDGRPRVVEPFTAGWPFQTQLGPGFLRLARSDPDLFGLELMAYKLRQRRKTTHLSAMPDLFELAIKLAGPAVRRRLGNSFLIDPRRAATSVQKAAADLADCTARAPWPPTRTAREKLLSLIEELRDGLHEQIGAASARGKALRERASKAGKTAGRGRPKDPDERERIDQRNRLILAWAAAGKSYPWIAGRREIALCSKRVGQIVREARANKKPGP